MADPLTLAWNWPLLAMETATKFVSTIVDSQTVIEARLPVLAKAVALAPDADYREVVTMVTEKGAAFTRSTARATRHRGRIQRIVGANARDLGRMAGGDVYNPTLWLELANRNLELWSAFATLPGEMLQPVHAKVSSNARRLGNRSAR